MSSVENLLTILNGLHISQTTVGLLIAATVFVLVIVVVVARLARRWTLAKIGTTVVVVIVLGTTIEGAIQFATYINAKSIEIVFPAVVFEAVGFAIYGRAKEYARLYGKGPGRWGKRLYLIGILAGAIVATAATNLGMVIFRFGMPIVASWLINMELEPTTEDTSSATSWRWTPRRMGIALGLVVPGDEDVEQVHREHLVRRMVATRRRYDSARFQWRKARHESKLIRLAEACNEEIINEVIQGCTRSRSILIRTDPMASRVSSAEFTTLPVGHSPATSSGTPVPVRATGTAVPVRPTSRTLRVLSDDECLSVLEQLARESAEPISIGKARDALRCGSDRARKLLHQAGLRPMNGSNT